jgi:predicted RNA-binding protein with RPS1 domain
MSIGDQPKPEPATDPNSSASTHSDSKASTHSDDAVQTDDRDAAVSSDDSAQNAADKTTGVSPDLSGDATAETSAADASAAASPSPEAAHSQAESSGEQTSSPSSQPGPPSKAARTRSTGPLAARGLGIAKPASPQGPVGEPTKGAGAAGKPGGGESHKEKQQDKKHPRPRVGASGGDSSQPQAEKPQAEKAQAQKPQPHSKVAVPNRRQSLPDDILAELEAQLASADVESMLSGSAGMADRSEPLGEGARVHGQVLKIHDDNVFFALGGPDEGVVPFTQFKEEPQPGQSIEVIVRGISNEDGLYLLSLPGATVDVSDWEDLDEGAVVVVTVTGHNAGGLECKVGGAKGFIPISQVTEYRVEDLSEFVDQKFPCVVTEANVRRGNLVLSRRAVLEREREEKRKEQLAKIEAGDMLEGIVRSIKDFGAFVDLGGLDGLIHISKLSWDRVKHPSEVLEVGQKVQVKIDTIDKETAKIGLSYRDLLENPWDTAESDFAVGSVHKGTVTRVAAFGCFVKLGPGIEGLVHISELAHHRVSRVDTMVNEGQEVDVKVLSFDRDAQKISLSIKAAQSAPADSASKSSESEPDEPPREPAVKATHSGPLKGGNNRDAGGERFGLRW